MDAAALIIRAVLALAVVAVLATIKYAYDEHVRAPLRAEFATKESAWKATEQSYKDTVAVNENTIKTQSASLSDVRKQLVQCSTSVSNIEAARETAASEAAKARAAAKAANKASQEKTDSLAAIAKGPEIRGDASCAMARKIGSDYAKDVRAAKVALGLVNEDKN